MQKILLSSAYYGFIIVLVTLGVLLIGMKTSYIKGYEIKIVQSGSMEPAIKTGSVVFIKKQPSYAVGDIVTFGVSSSKSLPTTHRIISEQLQAGQLVYQTKGDANEDPDPVFTSPRNIVGRALFSVPYLGYVLDFARKPLGFVLIVVIPALAVVFDEGLSIYREIRKRRQLATTDV